MPLPDHHMLLLRAVTLVKQDEEQIAEMLVGATAEEIAIDFMGLYAVSTALIGELCRQNHVTVEDVLDGTIARIVRSMPPVKDE